VLVVALEVKRVFLDSMEKNGGVVYPELRWMLALGLYVVYSGISGVRSCSSVRGGFFLRIM
jgi:hypothetical protein